MSKKVGKDTESRMAGAAAMQTNLQCGEVVEGHG